MVASAFPMGSLRLPPPSPTVCLGLRRRRQRLWGMGSASNSDLPPQLLARVTVSECGGYFPSNPRGSGEVTVTTQSSILPPVPAGLRPGRAESRRAGLWGSDKAFLPPLPPAPRTREARAQREGSACRTAASLGGAWREGKVFICVQLCMLHVLVTWQNLNYRFFEKNFPLDLEQSFKRKIFVKCSSSDLMHTF